MAALYEDLFDASLLRGSPVGGVSAPEDFDSFIFRPLRVDDYDRGFVEVMSGLTTVAPLSREEFVDRFRAMQRVPNTYYTIVIEDTSRNRLVAIGSIVKELKFIHSAGSIGHIEDIVVDSTMRGKRLGWRLIQALRYIGGRLMLYKIILDCSDDNVAFYKKCGFKRKGNEMAVYIPPPSKL